MIPTLIAVTLAMIVRSLAAVRLERWGLGAPAVMVLAGAAAGYGIESSAALAFNTTVAQHVAEIILAVLLFVDAVEIRGGRLLGNSPRLAVRILFVAMPIALAAATGLGALLFPGLSWAMLLVVACVVVPVDFAPSEQLLRDRRIPARVRSVLNVEGGYNDGIVSPIFLFALLLAGTAAHGATTPLAALTTALPQALKAIAVGIVLGWAVGWLLDRLSDRGWTTEQSRRITVLMLPVATYAVAAALGGNGFVASFVCGIAFRFVHRYLVARSLHRVPSAQRGRAPQLLARDFSLIEDVTTLLTMSMWFVVGIATTLVLFFGLDWRSVVFCLLALTVVRLLPVLLATVGSGTPFRDRLLLGVLGPRGTTTIVFGLLAYNGLPDGAPADTVLTVMVLCVMGSVVLHGVGGSVLVDRLPAPVPPPAGSRHEPGHPPRQRA